MRQFVSAWLLLWGVFAVVPESADAQIFRRPKRGCCETCEMPHANCTCTQTRPVVQTQLRAQQVTTYRDVTETHVRNETVVQNVPVTTYKQVTVDEGAYQMVWVPKPVTKQVAETVIQQQAQTRAVPYQVTRRVPQLTTQLVPVQTVQHITETVPMTAWAPPPVSFQAASSCNSCNAPFSTAFAPQFTASQFVAPQFAAPQQFGTAIAPSAQSAPITAAIPTMPAIPVPMPQTALGPLPPPENSPEQWQTIPSRPAPGAARTYESPSSRNVPIPMDEARVTSPRAGRFVPAPSAATVWNSRQGTSMR
jgi:hypothetical protein